MKVTSLCVIGALLCSCHATVGFPDRRSADIVIDEMLRQPTEQAITWWSEATMKQTDFRIVDECRDKQRSCITMRIKPLNNLGGFCKNWTRWDGTEGSDIAIDVFVAFGSDSDARHVVAHELGHALGLDHVFGDPKELMRPKGYGDSCMMHPGTQRQWMQLYGNNRVMPVCDQLQPTISVQYTSQ